MAVAASTDAGEPKLKLNLPEIDQETFAAISVAISHPLRTTILHLIKSFGKVSPKGIVDALEELGEPVPLANVSYHVRALADRRLIKLVNKVQRRGAMEHFYKLSPLGETTLERLGI